jgi:hypothetical protein
VPRPVNVLAPSRFFFSIICCSRSFLYSFFFASSSYQRCSRGAIKSLFELFKQANGEGTQKKQGTHQHSHTHARTSTRTSTSTRTRTRTHAHTRPSSHAHSLTHTHTHTHKHAKREVDEVFWISDYLNVALSPMHTCHLLGTVEIISEMLRRERQWGK